MTTLTLDVNPLNVSEEQFYDLCRVNRELRLERTAAGELVIMPPTGGETGTRNSSLTGQLWLWNEQHKLGQTFDSSTGFRLPNGAFRSPDASWIAQARWEALSAEEKQKFAPICPDFAVELRSPSDDLEMVRAKLQEYMANGARLGWLLDPETQRVEVYRPNAATDILVKPMTVSGEPILPGFVLDLSRIL